MPLAERRRLHHCHADRPAVRQPASVDTAWLPFLITQYRPGLLTAAIVIAFELLTLAWVRWRFFETKFLSSFASIAFGGAIIAGLSVALGSGG